MIPLHDKNRICPKCVCLSHKHYQACSALPPSCVRLSWTLEQTHPHGGQVMWSWMCSVTWGSSMRKRICPRGHRDLKFWCGDSTGRPPPYQERDANDCVDKNYYKMLIFFNCTKHLIFFIEILHLHKFTWGFFFWNQIHKVQTLTWNEMWLLNIK